MPAPSITPLPTAPQRTDAPAVFSNRADAWVAAIAGFTGELNTFGAYLNSLGLDPAEIPSEAVDLAMSTNRILGRTAAGSGAVEELTASQVLAFLGAATAAQIMAGTADKVVTADKLHDAHSPQTLIDAATISWDMSAAINAKVTLTASGHTLAVSNPKAGLTYVLEVIQDATGSRTINWPSSFNWGSAGAPTLSTGVAKADLVTLYCRDAATPKFRAVFNKDA